MCHFLPVYYLGIAFLGRGEGSKYNTSSFHILQFYSAVNRDSKVDTIIIIIVINVVVVVFFIIIIIIISVFVVVTVIPLLIK